MSIIDRIVPATDERPNMYRTSCALCSFVAFERTKKNANAAWDTHRCKSHHEVGFIRAPLVKRK